MAFTNQQQFISTLEKAGELVRIKAYVDPRLEMAEITDRMSKQPGGGKALLFEDTGFDFPVLMNAYGSEKRMCMALGVEHLVFVRGQGLLACSVGGLGRCTLLLVQPFRPLSFRHPLSVSGVLGERGGKLFEGIARSWADPFPILVGVTLSPGR